MFKTLITTGVRSGLVFLILPATAQQAQPDANAPARKGDQIEQVIVTSQKRSEDVEKIPLSVSVLSAETLKEDHITDFTDLTRNIPNMSFSTQAGAGLGTLEIRGVSSQAGSAAVGVYLDDVSLTTRNLYSQGTAEPRFFDLERVEALRGPQGTLYGAGSLGGTVRFISRQPNLKSFGANADLEFSQTQHGSGNWMAQAVVNVPIAPDTLALRVGVQEGSDSGYIDLVDPRTLQVTQSGINSTHWTVGKLAAKLRLLEGWTVTPALFSQVFKSDDIDASYLTVGTYQQFNPGVPLPPFQTSKIVREPGEDRLTIPSVTLNGDVGFGDLTGVFSLYKRQFDRTQDGTSVNSSFLPSLLQPGTPASLAQIGFLPSAVYLNNNIDQRSFELRVASKPYEPGQFPLTWLGGAYYSRERTDVVDNEPIFGINAAFNAAGVSIADPNVLSGAFPNDFPKDNSYFSARHYDDRQTSLFGELTYHLTPSLGVAAGARSLWAAQGFRREGDFFYAGGPSSVAISNTTQATTPSFSIDWDVDPTTLLYAKIAKGFRLGAANRPIPNTAAVQQDLTTLHLSGFPPTFQPDSLWNYEVGSKMRLLDNRLTLNTAAFYIDWSNIQQDVILPVSGYDFETNVGNATSYGLEVEARAKVLHGLTLEAAASWTHATFSDDQPALGLTNGALNVRSGDPIQGVPSYFARVGGEYTLPLSERADGFVRLNTQWTGPSHGSFVRSSADYFRPSYLTLDASAGVSWEKWDVSLFVKNLTNDSTILQQPSIQSVPEVYQLRPRTIGIHLTATW
ncbi:MAG TPA: TonB-dependent receptor [Burkholderiaceae bacterium]|nr:TonB-dependent receptor [Burkholderiaceae bacterium]